jgi:hypothetical protein
MEAAILHPLWIKIVVVIFQYNNYINILYLIYSTRPLIIFQTKYLLWFNPFIKLNNCTLFIWTYIPYPFFYDRAKVIFKILFLIVRLIVLIILTKIYIFLLALPKLCYPYRFLYAVSICKVLELRI